MKFIIEGSPIPQQRHRNARRGNITIQYDPQVKFKKIVQQSLSKQVKEAFNSYDKEIVLDMSYISRACAFYIEFIFFMPIRNSTPIYAKNLQQWNLEEANCKPDIDNLEKFYLDCSKGILFGDDAMIVDSKASKRFSINPRTIIKIKPKKGGALGNKHESIFKIMNPHQVEEFVTNATSLSNVIYRPSMHGSETVEEMVAQMEEDEKQRYLRRVGDVLLEFAEAFADPLMKIKKCISK